MQLPTMAFINLNNPNAVNHWEDVIYDDWYSPVRCLSEFCNVQRHEIAICNKVDETELQSRMYIFPLYIGGGLRCASKQYALLNIYKTTK